MRFCKSVVSRRDKGGILIPGKVLVSDRVGIFEEWGKARQGLVSGDISPVRRCRPKALAMASEPRCREGSRHSAGRNCQPLVLKNKRDRGGR
jgi:hypothetical protein